MMDYDTAKERIEKMWIRTREGNLIHPSLTEPQIKILTFLTSETGAILIEKPQRQIGATSVIVSYILSVMDQDAPVDSLIVAWSKDAEQWLRGLLELNLPPGPRRITKNHYELRNGSHLYITNDHAQPTRGVKLDIAYCMDGVSFNQLPVLGPAIDAPAGQIIYEVYVPAGFKRLQL